MQSEIVSGQILAGDLTATLKAIHGANERILSHLPDDLVDAYRAGCVSSLLAVATAHSLNVPELREAQLAIDRRRKPQGKHAMRL